MGLNSRVLGATGLSVGALFIVLANNGKAFFDGLLSVPVLVKAFAAVLPLGTGSVLMSMCVSGTLYYWIERVAPTRWTSQARDLGAEFAALLACIAMTVVQVAMAPPATTEPKPSVWLIAIALGFVGGTLAPFLSKVLIAVARKRGAIQLPARRSNGDLP